MKIYSKLREIVSHARGLKEKLHTTRRLVYLVARENVLQHVKRVFVNYYYLY